MSDINHEAAKVQAELFAKNPQGYFTWETVNYGLAYLDLASRLEAAHAKIEKYQRRLEITHYYDGHTGERKEIPPENRDTHPDGIECRDSTIHMLKTELERNYPVYKAHYDLCFPPKGTPASEIETLHDEFLTARDNRLVELETENAELRARLEEMS